MPEDIEAEEKIGAIAMLDLLGYKNFLSSNEITTQIQALDNIIEPSIISAVEFVSKTFSGPDNMPASREIKEKMKKIGEIQKMEWQILSDTIILYLPISEDGSFEAGLGWAKILYATKLIFIALLQQGFPVRGSICWGKFIKRKNYFVGRPLVEAHTEAENQEWIGCTLASSAANQLKGKQEINEILKLDRMFPLYPVPTKKGIAHLRALNWSKLPLADGQLSTNIRPFLFSTCSSHYKTVDEAVIRKINNSEAFYWHLVINNLMD